MTLGRGQRSNIINFGFHVIYQTLCVFSQMKDTTYHRGFSFCLLSHAPGVGLWGHGGAQGVKKYFFKHGHVTYQIDRDDEQNRMQVKFSS